MRISTSIAATAPATFTAAELVRRARALNRVYQQTWRLEDVEAQICCYLLALNLLFEASDDDEPRYARATPTTKNSVAGEPLAKEEDGHQLCEISAWRGFIAK